MAHPSKDPPVVPRIQTHQRASPSKTYSWTETPVELGRPPYRHAPVSSPTASTIDESPVSTASPGTRFLPHYTEASPGCAPIREEKANAQSPQEIHPAYSAPVMGEMQMQPAQRGPNHAVVPAGCPQPVVQVTAPTPLSPSAPPTNLSSIPQSQHLSSHSLPLKHQENCSIKPQQRIEPDVYNPSSLQGPNGPQNHCPGQVSHPNANTNPHWTHSMCEPSSLCCMSIFCPCMIYGKTMYRLSRKTQRQDPTDLLGHESCNGSCGLFAVACGFQWALAAIQRTRIRKAYGIEGEVTTDCVKSLFCCCCVVAQDEREMKEREEAYRRNAGPSRGYALQSGMSYAPPPR